MADFGIEPLSLLAGSYLTVNEAMPHWETTTNIRILPACSREEIYFKSHNTHYVCYVTPKFQITSWGLMEGNRHSML